MASPSATGRAVRKKLTDRFEVVEGLFESVTAKADVFFEICLHEMDDPDAALANARSLASNIIVFDHLLDGPHDLAQTGQLVLEEARGENGDASAAEDPPRRRPRGYRRVPSAGNDIA